MGHTFDTPDLKYDDGIRTNGYKVVANEFRLEIRKQIASNRRNEIQRNLPVRGVGPKCLMGIKIKLDTSEDHYML